MSNENGYTPTTEDVREDFAFPWSPEQIGDRPARVAAFDRWLVAHDAEVAATERERVGLILDAVQSSLDSNSSYCDCSGYQRVEWLEDQFAAIRGGESE